MESFQTNLLGSLQRFHEPNRWAPKLSCKGRGSQPSRIRSRNSRFRKVFGRKSLDRPRNILSNNFTKIIRFQLNWVSRACVVVAFWLGCVRVPSANKSVMDIEINWRIFRCADCMINDRYVGLHQVLWVSVVLGHAKARHKALSSGFKVVVLSRKPNRFNGAPKCQRNV